MKYSMPIVFAIMIYWLASSCAHAKDGWQCEETGTSRSGNTFVACGVGSGGEEGQARKQALRQALDEFTTICNLSNDCRGRDKFIEPKRMTCAEDRHTQLWTCTRMIEISLK